MKSKLQTPWGFDGVIVSTDKYSAKIIIVKEGEKTPYGCNMKKDKTLFVLQGEVHINVEGNLKSFGEGGRYRVRPKVNCSIEAVKGDATILEVGTEILDDFVEV